MTDRDFFQGLETASKKVIFVSGKGGVGKTTSAISIAVMLARHHKTLLISTDPAHSISDGLAIHISTSPASLAIDGHQLYGMQVDATQEFEQFKERHADELQQLMDTSTYFDQEDINQILDMMIPGIDEVMGLKALIELHREAAFDKIVVDMAPTGHSLRLLAMPKILDQWIKLLASLRWKYRLIQKTFKGKYSPDDADDMLLDLKRIVSNMHKLLQDKEATDFILVSTPNQMVRQETHRFYQELKSAGIPTRKLILNYLFKASSDPFYQQLYQSQQAEIAHLPQDFPGMDIYQVPILNQEAIGLEMAQQFSSYLQS